jgi:transcriptional regulator with XRE-family HTH domain
MDKARFGNLIRSRREAAGLDVAELARRVKLSREVLGKYERGEREHPLDPENVNAIAEALGNVSVLELVTAMGYRLAFAGFDGPEIELIEMDRRLSPASKKALRAGAQALVEQFPAEAPATS